jgi:alkanesulfonate monooxygenase SsuD/methylene tetrahydromethanopterin reductase-like flavin-dependent oxidoreductase (luciferase family)
MKAAFFSSVFYMAPAPGGWPAASTGYAPQEARRSMQTALEQFRLADDVGFDWVTVAEHHFGPMGLTPNPMVFAGALTQVVKRARIALLGPNVPILNPVRVAEEFAMLDTLTDGRVIAGMMRGTPNEYVTYNINPAESRAIFEEALLLIRHAWTQTQPFGWQGRHFQFRSISLWPRPVQQPHPPIFISGSSPESAAFAAHNRLSLGLAVTTVPQAAKSVAIYRNAAREAGWTPLADDILYRLSFHVAESDAQARADLQDSRRLPQRLSPVRANPALEATVAATGYYGVDLSKQRARMLLGQGVEEQIAAGQVIIGSPDTVRSQIRAIADQLGAGVLDLVPAFQSGEPTMRSIRLFGETVLPCIRDL